MGYFCVRDRRNSYPPTRGLLPLCLFPFHFDNGRNANKETMAKRKTTEQFIQEAEMVHGKEKMDFSKAEYKNNYTPIPVTCKICGCAWHPTPKNILNGTGCPQCARGLAFGFGVKDIPTPTNDPATVAWNEMLKRCYYEPHLKREESYRDCSVCDEWLVFSNFQKWYDQNHIDGYEIDKDILVKGNKVYSPDTCCFIPKEINQIFTNRHNHRGDAPIGSTLRKDGFYQVRLSKFGKSHHIGWCKTSEDAFAIYKQAKETHIKETAQMYFKDGKISERVYNALMRYEVEITD